MNEQTISDNKKYLVSFETRFILKAGNYEEAMEQMKSEILNKIKEADSKDTNLSIHLIDTPIQDEGDHQLSYIDDWEFDDRW